LTLPRPSPAILPGPRRIRDFRIRGTYINTRQLLRDLDEPPPGGQGRLAPAVSFWTDDPVGQGEIVIRDVDVPLLLQPDVEEAKRALSLMLASRAGDPGARTQLQQAVELHRSSFGRQGAPNLIESRYVVPSTSQATYPVTAVSHKGSILLQLARLGYPVPDFVILTGETHAEWDECGEQALIDALDNLADMTGETPGSAEQPLLFAMRACMPYYVPGFMPTYLNVGATEGTLPALERTYGRVVANKILLNNLKNIIALLDPASAEGMVGRLDPYLEPDRVSRLVDQISSIVRKKDPGLLTDPFQQALFFVRQAHRHYDENTDVLMTLSRGNRFHLSLVLQKMVCSVRDDQSYAGVLYSRHSQTGEGVELQTGRNIFGEELMTGTVEPEETRFVDRSEIKDLFPAVYHFAPSLKPLEREFEAPVTIEFATETTRGHEFFALLQLNNMAMTGRAAFISVVDLHKEGTISRKRVTELICPYHVKQVESDTIDSVSLEDMVPFCHGVSILPRRAVCCRIYFSAEAALSAKKRGEMVCLCKRTFEPGDTVVMREMDGIVSITAAAIHVVTICQSFGIPGLLSLEKHGVTLTPERCLVNAEGDQIREGDGITMSSRRQVLYKGHAKFKPARLIRYMEGKPVNVADNEQQAFADMAYAYRYYQQLVRGMKLDQISKLNELIRLVNLELRGEVEQARNLVRGWFDGHEGAYVEEVLRSDLGDHLNQHTVFDMLTLERKVRFFKDALVKCKRERISGFTAGAFMLGRFISRPHAVAFWQAFGPAEIGLLVNEWVLFEKYLQVLHEVGERRIVRAKKRILQDGLDEILLTAWNVKCLVPLKLSKAPLDEIREALPEWCDFQTANVVELLKRPYRDFYDFGAPWSVAELEAFCEEGKIPVPGPDDT
jgi:hypothetical protein